MPSLLRDGAALAEADGVRAFACVVGVAPQVCVDDRVTVTVGAINRANQGVAALLAELIIAAALPRCRPPRVPMRRDWVLALV